jgi:hypothetical protein
VVFWFVTPFNLVGENQDFGERSLLSMEAVCNSESLVIIYQTKLQLSPEDSSMLYLLLHFVSDFECNPPKPIQDLSINS